MSNWRRGVRQDDTPPHVAAGRKASPDLRGRKCSRFAVVALIWMGFMSIGTAPIPG